MILPEANILLLLGCYVMPIRNFNTNSRSKNWNFDVRGKSAASQEESSQKEEKQLLNIVPVLPILPGAPLPPKLTKRSYSSLSSTGSILNGEDAEVGGSDIITLHQSGEGRMVLATRTLAEREKNPDRISLDRRGLTTFPNIVDEPKLRLISLQHNLISKIEVHHLTQLTKLVFLDLYDNQIEKLCNMNTLENLRVLLIGKNRIKKVEGLKQLNKLEVLDLHGNQITQISGLDELSSLKVLNLAGNNIKVIGCNDFQGLTSLKELNLRRNKIKKLLGFGNTPQLQKVYLSNNDIHRIEDMGSLANALQLKEVAIDGNPVTLIGESVSFLVSYLPNLQVISTMHITEHIRRAAMAWRTTKEQSNPAFLDLSTQVCINVRREEVISNAKTNWELLRSQAKCFTNGVGKQNPIKSDHVRGLQLQNSKELETVKLKGLGRTKSEIYGSLTSINENVETKKKHLKKRSNSSDNIVKCENKINPLEFKLPPVLVPIIDNITRKKANKYFESDKGACFQKNIVDLNSDSERESSESHESLKSGLRCHLINSNNRAISFDCDISNELSVINSNKESTLAFAFDSGQNDSHDSESYKGIFNKTLKSFLNQEDMINGLVKSSLSCSRLESLKSKTSSLDSAKSGLSDTSSSSLSKVSSEVSLEIRDEKDRVKSAQEKKIVYYKSNKAAIVRAKHKFIPPSSPPPQSNPPKEKEQGGDYLIEIIGRCLNVYGQGALRFIDRPWDANKASEVNVVKFNYIQFNGVALMLNRLKNRFSNIEHYIFKETNISHLGQLNALAEVQGLSSFQIEAEGNPIISKNWRMYSVFRLVHWGLKTINGNEIAEEDIQNADQEYSGLADVVMWSLPESLLQPLLQRLNLEKAQSQNGAQYTAKQFLFSSDPALRNVVAKEALQWRRGNITQEDLIWRHKGKVHLSQLIDQTIDAIQKLQILDNDWPNILYEIIRDTLKDYSDMNVYMKQRCKILTEEIKY